MSLKVKKSIKYYIPRVILGLLILIAAIFLGRVAIWEYRYYTEKEGSERATVPSLGDVSSSEQVDVTEITDSDKEVYIVAAEMPRFLTIEKLGIKNARILQVGTMPNGQMSTPANINDVGWWTGSNKPGTGGTAILDGHSGAGIEGIFDHLPSLVAGDIITIELGNGSLLTYRVYDNITVPLANANDRMHTLAISPVYDTESLSIISCTGEWNYNQDTFNSRQFLRATLVSRTASEAELKSQNRQVLTLGH